MESLNWLHLIPTSALGGCETLARRVAERLPEDKHTFVLPDTEGPIAHLLANEGHRIEVFSGLGPRTYFSSRKSRDQLARLVVSASPDVIVAWMGQPAVPALANVPTRPTTSILAHGASVYQANLKNWTRDLLYVAMCRGFGRKTNGIRMVACSEAVRTSYRRSPFLRQFNSTTILNGIPPQVEDRWQPKKAATIRVIGMVARFDAAKDHATLVRAMLHLDKNVHLELVGGGAGRESLAQLVAELGLSERVHFLGVLSEPHRKMASWDVSVFAGTEIEGFALAVAESLAVGAPVVASRAGGIPEAVGDAGLLVDPGDPRSLAEAVRRILHDWELAEALSLAGQLRADNVLSIERCAREWRNQIAPST